MKLKSLLEGNWVAKSKDGVTRRFKSRDEAEAWERTYANIEPLIDPVAEKSRKFKSYDDLWDEAAKAISRTFPEGDPFDYLIPYMKKEWIHHR